MPEQSTSSAAGQTPAPGVRSDRSESQIQSRSADPGQSSYGGFKNEDTRFQHQSGNAAQGGGQAGQPAAQQAAQQAGQQQGGSRSDERLRDRVCEQLWRTGLDVSEVSVEVSGGYVTLEGTVASRDARRAIEDCVDRCTGVADITNRIRVEPDRTSQQQ
jgi:osmotically-inducible protein OsmY